MVFTDSHKEEGVLRCYSKYIFLDVVEFSKRSAEAQSEVVQYLNQIVRQTIEAHNIAQDSDCILIPTGDGMCIALISPNVTYDAHIQIALGILRSIHEHNNVTSNITRRFQVRMGINQNTDILITDINGRRNIAGAGINMASRIMDKADGGQILVSRAVFDELQPSEVYMDKFKGFTASGKHNVSFQVHQYIGPEHDGLNTTTPSTFATRTGENKLAEQVAHYFAHSIMHRQDLLRIKESTLFNETAAIVLLKLLADDSYRLSKASEFESAPTMHTEGAGKRSFDEQYTYYSKQNLWVLFDAEANIVHGRPQDDGLALSQHSDCFEYRDYIPHYSFINAAGREKLKREWPDVWKNFELDKYDH